MSCLELAAGAAPWSWKCRKMTPSTGLEAVILGFQGFRILATTLSGVYGCVHAGVSWGWGEPRAFFNYRPAQEVHSKQQAERKWSDEPVWGLRTH